MSLVLGRMLMAVDDAIVDVDVWILDGRASEAELFTQFFEGLLPV